MISSPLLSDYEACPRRGYFARDWLPRRLHPTEITRRGIYSSLSSGRQDVGEAAGEEVMTLCADYGLDIQAHNLHDIGLHHAAIADLVATYLKNLLRCDISVPEDKGEGDLLWESSSLMTGQGRLLRIVLVDYLSDDRLLSESRSWYTLGEVAVYDAPMDIHVIALGNSRQGKRHSAWSRALLHPRNRSTIRFKKKAHRVQGFAETWLPIWREEYAQIPRERWLRQMIDDDVMPDLTATFKVERVSQEKREDLLDIIRRKSHNLSKIGYLPDPCFSQCDWPRPCPFRTVCFSPVTTLPGDLGFRSRQ